MNAPGKNLKPHIKFCRLSIVQHTFIYFNFIHEIFVNILRQIKKKRVSHEDLGNILDKLECTEPFHEESFSL